MRGGKMAAENPLEMKTKRKGYEDESFNLRSSYQTGLWLYLWLQIIIPM